MDFALSRCSPVHGPHLARYNLSLPARGKSPELEDVELRQTETTQLGVLQPLPPAGAC